MKQDTAIAISLAFAIAFVMLLSAGCIEKSKSLGCCVDANATKDHKCYWFNMSNDRLVDMYAKTTSCDQENKMCNVTLEAGKPDAPIPFCTDDTITQCIKPDCLAMACGDFIYRPKVAPGVASAEEAANNAPADEGEGGTQALYNAQCRLLPMDSKFKIKMKTSKSAINNFRFGIGQDFDEYDYYHYYFPISDKYCVSNPLGSIDRYINYLQPGSSGTTSSYDPENMATACTTDAAPAPPASFAPVPTILPASSGAGGPPLSIFLVTQNTVTAQQAFGMNPKFIVDEKSYKYMDYLGYVFSLTEHIDNAGKPNQEITVDWPDKLSRLTLTPAYYYEKLDRSFYRKELSTAYLTQFYSPTVARAPFECSTQAYECLSGQCSNDFYNRGVNVVTDSDGQDSYVPTDCKNAKTASGMSVVVCYPTINASNDGGTAHMTYANATYRPWQMVLATEDYNQGQLTNKQEDQNYPSGNFQPSGVSITQCVYKDNHNKCQLDWLWNNFFTASTTDFANWWHSGQPFYNTVFPSELFGDYVTVSGLPSDFNIYWNGTDTISSVDTTSSYPPASQIVFFDNPDVKYDGQTIIGYAVADPGEFEKTYFAKSCIFAKQTTEEDFFFSPCQGDVCGYERTRLGCQTQCQALCPAAAQYGDGSTTLSRCVAYCHALLNATPPVDPANPYNTPYPPSPCKYNVTITGGANTFIKVDLSGTGQEFRDNYQKLLTAFGPLYNDTMESYTNSPDWKNKCNTVGTVDINNLFFAAMPWIPEYKKPLNHTYSQRWPSQPKVQLELDVKSILNSPAQYFYRDVDNTYDQPASSQFQANDLCTLEKATGRAVSVGQSVDDWGSMTYKALLPKTIYLLKGTTDSAGNMKVGRCNVVQGSTLPQIQTFGWCEPCTLATLAYQNITAGTKSVTSENRVAIPSFEQELKVGTAATRICTVEQGSGNITTSCSSRTISDIGDYSNMFVYHDVEQHGYTYSDSNCNYYGGSCYTYWSASTIDVTPDGAPRTDQGAALIKERMGNYLKSGIMPVMDISDKSNWNLTSLYVVQRISNSSGTEDNYNYTGYDFQRLLGNNGAMVVIVDTFNPNSASVSRSRILNRTGVVRATCSRCLTAVRVLTNSTGLTYGVTSYNDSLKKLFSTDPRLKINVDMIVTDYDTDIINWPMAGSRSGPAHYNTGLLPMSTDARVSYVLNDMESYGLAALKYSKPVMITKFTVTDDQFWNDSTYESLFSGMVTNEDQLVKSGIIGIIYSPVRVKGSDTAGQALSLVKTTEASSVYGSAGGGGPSPIKAGVETVAGAFSNTASPSTGVKTKKFCALETAMNKMAGTNPYATFVQVDAMPSVNCTLCSSLEKAQGLCNQTCDNGVKCVLPLGLKLEQKNDYRCPGGVVAGSCTLCNQTNEVYNCIKTYGNGTVETMKPIDSAVVKSDAFQDVIAGLEKPDKCCLRGADGTNYTYVKKMYYTSVTSPVVFSRIGDPNQDCGIGTGRSLTDLGGFCGVSLPVENFDITCTASPK
jgi:hypothetical protein